MCVTVLEYFDVIECWTGTMVANYFEPDKSGHLFHRKALIRDIFTCQPWTKSVDKVFVHSRDPGDSVIADVQVKPLRGSIICSTIVAVLQVYFPYHFSCLQVKGYVLSISAEPIAKRVTNFAGFFEDFTASGNI